MCAPCLGAHVCALDMCVPLPAPPCCAAQEWTGEACVGDALLEVAARLPRAKMLISTQGSRGSICLLRQQQRQVCGARVGMGVPWCGRHVHASCIQLHAPAAILTPC
jgi:hypothetical protein